MTTIEIYQMRMNDETHGIKFRDLDSLKERGIEFNFALYDKVYEMDADAENLSDKAICEDMFVIFNQYRPDDFKGHSLSVSDLVVIDGRKYYCDDFGFELVE